VHVPKQLAEALERENKPIPGGISGFALVDTGASMICVDRKVIEQLGMAPVSEANVGTAGGVQKQLVYPAMLRFPNTTMPELNIWCLGGDFAGQGDMIALIGRDVLSLFVLVYNGPGASITLAY